MPHLIINCRFFHFSPPLPRLNRGTRTDGYAASGLLQGVTSVAMAEESGSKAPSALTPSPDPDDGIDDDQRISKYVV